MAVLDKELMKPETSWYPCQCRWSHSLLSSFRHEYESFGRGGHNESYGHHDGMQDGREKYVGHERRWASIILHFSVDQCWLEEKAVSSMLHHCSAWKVVREVLRMLQVKLESLVSSWANFRCNFNHLQAWLELWHPNLEIKMLGSMSWCLATLRQIWLKVREFLAITISSILLALNLDPISRPLRPDLF